MSDLLLVTSSTEEARVWLAHLERSGWRGKAEVLTAPSEIYQRCRIHPFHAILLDQAHPLITTRLTSELLRRLDGHPPVILITEAPGEAGALEGLAMGAFDYVFRSCLDRLPLATHRAVENTDLRLDLQGADQHLREAEHRFQALADLVTAGVAIEGADGILHANQGLGLMLSAGGSPLDLLGRPLLSFVAPEHLEGLEEKLSRAPSAEHPLEMDVTLVGTGGVPVQAWLTGAEIGFHGQPARLFVIHDQREKRRTESAIAGLASFAQENPNPVLMFSADARLTYYNEAALDMARSLGREHPAGCVPPQAAAIVEECLLTGEKRLRVSWTQNKRVFSWSFFPYPAGSLVHALVLETTEQATLEAQLHHSQRLEAVGRLAGGVGHEFSNLLTVIRGQADILREETGLSPRSRDAMQQLLHAVEQAGRVTLQLQAFSRRSPVKLETLDLAPLLRKLAELLGKTLGEDIRLEVDLQPGLPSIRGDRALLEQAFLNLAVSARDRMPAGGELRISASVVENVEGTPLRHAEARYGRFVRVSFCDSEIGLDPAMLPYLFEPFLGGADSEATRSLGLSTSHGILKQHQGWIEVSSPGGSGTGFHLHLPIPTYPDDPPASGSAGPLHPALHRVLLVEDDLGVRLSLKGMLENAGYGVIEASNPLEALAVWRSHQETITILLSDLVMPTGITGQELARHLQQTKPGLRVVFTSGYCIDSVAKGMALEPGVNFLQKPFDARAFTAALARQQSTAPL